MDRRKRAKMKKSRRRRRSRRLNYSKFVLCVCKGRRLAKTLD